MNFTLQKSNKITRVYIQEILFYKCLKLLPVEIIGIVTLFWFIVIKQKRGKRVKFRIILEGYVQKGTWNFPYVVLKLSRMFINILYTHIIGKAKENEKNENRKNSNYCISFSVAVRNANLTLYLRNR